MSASREKKQRQNADVSAKEAQQKQEQAAQKRKVYTYVAIGVVVVVLVAALLTWNSGIFQSGMTAATVGGNNMSVAELSYYYGNARNNEFYYYSMFGSTPPTDDTVRDETTGQTYREYFLETALSTAQRVQVWYDGAVAAGHTASEVSADLADTVSSVRSTASTYGYSYGAYLKQVFGQYMTTSAFEKMTEKGLLADLYYSEVQKDYSEGYSEEDLEAYYADHADEVDKVEYSYLYFRAETVSSTDEDGNELDEDTVARMKEEAMNAAQISAQNALNEYNGGETVTDLIAEYEPYSSADHTSVAGISSISSIYQEELLALDPEEATLVENADQGYYLVVFHSRARSEDPYSANVRHILFRAESSTDDDGNVIAPTEEAWNAAQEKAQAALDEYLAGEQTAEAFAALSDKYSDDANDDHPGGLYEGITPNSGYVTEFLDWIFEDGRQVGDTGIIQHQDANPSSSSYFGYHVMYLDSWEEADWRYRCRTALTNDAMEADSEARVGDNYATSLTDNAELVGI